jgi:hypothetical protein
MNIDELRAQLEQLAGPEPSPTEGAREAVRGRVRRARRRTTLVTAVAGVLVITIVVAGVHAAQDSPVGVRTLGSTTPTVPTGSECAVIPPAVPAADVPSDVSAWAHGGPVIGERELWTVRSAPAVQINPQPDGTWLLKFPWFTRPFGIPTFTGARLDGPGTFRGNGDQAIDQRGVWVVSSLEFSTPGCWEVTARYQTSAITFRILIGGGRQSTGTITGALRVVGGPAPGTSAAVGGTIHINGRDGNLPLTTRRDGTFSALLRAGDYTVTGTARGSGLTCSADNPVVVTAGHTTHADVICNID